MNIEDTLPGDVAHAPAAEETAPCEVEAQQLEAIKRQNLLGRLSEDVRNAGYDPYNTGSHPRFQRTSGG